MSRTSLIELDAVVTVARRGNFRAAAIDLGMSPSALSHAIAAIEARLGVRLFHRTTRSVSLSEAGEQFVAQVGPALLDIRTAMEAVNTYRDTPAGTIRINSAVGAARQVMGPIIFEYMRRYPDMRVEIVTEGKLVDIVADGFDAGVRLAEFLPQDVIAIPFGPHQRMAVVGAPDYFARYPIPKAPADLLQHRCIRSRMSAGSIYRWEFERRGEEMAIDVQGPLTLDESTLMLQAALAGIGLTQLSEWDVAPHVAAGRLVHVLQDWTPPFEGLCLYYPSRRHLPAGLRALVDLIRETAAAHR